MARYRLKQTKCIYCGGEAFEVLGKGCLDGIDAQMKTYECRRAWCKALTFEIEPKSRVQYPLDGAASPLKGAQPLFRIGYL